MHASRRAVGVGAENVPTCPRPQPCPARLLRNPLPEQNTSFAGPVYDHGDGFVLPLMHPESPRQDLQVRAWCSGVTGLL
jgi:hypothetical protein